MPLRIGITFGNKSKREPYVAAARAAGLEPVAIAPAEPRESLAGLSGLMLSGGADWGEQGNRDDIEAALLKEALGRDIPVLGICRGLQLMNKVAGGTLHHHIDGHRIETGPEKNVRHRVRTTRGTKLCSIVGEEIVTNSRHHQAIDKLAPGYTISALAEDGVREGIERKDRAWVVGVQWHPEDLIGEAQHLRLFQEFAAAVGRAAQQGR